MINYLFNLFIFLSFELHFTSLPYKKKSSKLIINLYLYIFKISDFFPYIFSLFLNKIYSKKKIMSIIQTKFVGSYANGVSASEECIMF